MKTWQVLAIIGAIVIGFVIHAAFPRYTVDSHKVGTGAIVIKLDRWTGQTSKYVTNAGWVPLDYP